MAVSKGKASKSALVQAPSHDVRQFRKHNDAIGLRVVEGSLTLLTRKVFNILIYHAQEQKETGLNAPIDTPTARKYFWIPLSELARDAAYDSKDTQHLKEQLQSLTDIKLVMENDRQWTSERLVSSISIVNPDGLKKNTGRVWIGYAFPPEMHEQVMQPSTYTRLSIVYQSSLKSSSALALYEVCRRYATNPSKLTFSESYPFWFGVLTGNPVTEESLPEFKYFKRDTLKPAIAEVNQLTDITVELITHRNGRKIDQLQFRVEMNKQPQLEFPAPPVVDMELVERIMGLGFSKTDATDISAQFHVDVIHQAMSRLEIRLANPAMTKLESKGGYFRWLLKDLVKNPMQTVEANPPAIGANKASTSSEPSVLERFLTARAKEAFDIYEDTDGDERKALFESFKESQHGSVKLSRGLDSPLTKSLFSRWYAQQLWGDPTATALASYIEQASVGAR